MVLLDSVAGIIVRSGAVDFWLGLLGILVGRSSLMIRRFDWLMKFSMVVPLWSVVSFEYHEVEWAFRSPVMIGLG